MIAVVRGSCVVLMLAGAGAANDFDWKLPAGFPKPSVPQSNPMSAAKVELGRHLFYDKRMSRNGTQSCATCHRQDRAFTDGKARAEGSTGEIHPRSSMSLVNVAYVPLLTWANPQLQTLEDQAMVPMFGGHPIELGLLGYESEFLSRLRQDGTYKRLFREAYPNEAQPYSIAGVIKAVASFERTIISARSSYDRFRSGDANAIPESAKRGEKLFFSEKTTCDKCHGSFTFGGDVRFEGGQEPNVWFFSTGVTDSYPEGAAGLHQHTLNRGDIGRFRPPALRNVALTAPYMHVGSIATLAEVIDHYAAGGRVPNIRNRSSLASGFELGDGEKADLIAFLGSLTDGEMLRDPRWRDPWPAGSSRKP
jgi:cytochrome c peroxidase